MSDCDIPNKCPFCGEHTFCVNARPRPELKEREAELLRRVGDYRKWAEYLMENDFPNEGDKIFAWEQFGAAKEFLELCIQDCEVQP